MDFTLNSMTLLGLTLAVGIVIDDAIIVLENIYRYIDEKGVPPMQAAMLATKEISLAVMATTLSLVIIFVPIAFMTGYARRYREPVRLDHGDVHHGLHAGGLHPDAHPQRPHAARRAPGTSRSTAACRARLLRPRVRPRCWSGRCDHRWVIVADLRW